MAASDRKRDLTRRSNDPASPGNAGQGRRRFDALSGEDVVLLVEQNPLAWIFANDTSGPFVTAAPMRPVIVDGKLTRLVSHVPRGGRLAAAMRARYRALILFIGPHGYVSPSWMSDRTQAPTWNFASAQFTADLELKDDAAYLEAHLRDLTSALETGRDRAWQVDEMGPRFERLAARIVAFEAVVAAGEPRFKLGQDENDPAFAEILDALEAQGSRDLVSWMRRFNPARS